MCWWQEAFDGDPAAEAGIKAKDIIMSVNGKNVDSSRDLTRLIAGLAVGSKADIPGQPGRQIKDIQGQNCPPG
ncbi:MAG: PDZ domain-containing protein [Desulfobacterales bacterium]